MNHWLLYLAAITFVCVLVMLIEFAMGNRSLHRLRETPPLSKDDKAQKVSVIIAARNEERKIEPALQSVLTQSYPSLEFIVVDDRSSDSTGKVLDAIAAKDPRLRVVHISELPKGWLGKNHAQHTGAGQASGEWLLFTDADVVFEPTTISRAIALAQREKLDHLAVAPEPRMPGMLLSMFGGAFTLFFGFYAKPWKASDPKSQRHIGIGAFNLVRAEVYRAVGGHSRIAMRPDDDMKLGKIIKLGGYRQDIVLGADFISVEWYSSVGELVHGLEKNSFAGLNYNLALVIAASVGQLIVLLWPVVALFVTGGATWWLNLGTVIAMAALFVDNTRHHGQCWWHFVGFPLTVLLFQYIIWRATLKTLRNDGIDWRGTHYSLAELKANKV
jgi:glycosyltransferase involved in cell wall biosynthesis